MVSKYDVFDESMQRVPVQYGKMSKFERSCRHLGTIGSIPNNGEVIIYFRIMEDMPGAGRTFFVQRMIDDKGRLWTFARYLRATELPKIILDAIKDQTGTVHVDMPEEMSFKAQWKRDVVR